MSTKIENQESRFDGLKWLAVVVLVTVGVVGNYAFAAESLLYRVLALVVLSGLAGYIALQTVKGDKFASLVKEARIEIRKVVWPTRQELVQTTMIVVVFVLVVALVLWGIDSLVSWSISGIIG
ncbi:MAG: preprotein translocase subunit SecE [Hahellaceae bacterium]|nr:preprotein translocase subunit SecE [Hahellaceae bacterium]MCP5168532.1 preprotein translocase subunit SecE [Hahellaceae bacterium]